MRLLRSMREFERIFRDEILTILGEGVDVRIGWQRDGAEGWSIDKDYLFVTVTESSSGDITQSIDELVIEAEDSFILRNGLTRVMDLHLVAYGATSYLNLVQLRRAFFLGRAGLRREKIYAIPDSNPVQRTPELFRGRWWERADTDILFNALVVMDEEIHPIEVVDLTTKSNEPLASTAVHESTQTISKEES